LESIDLKTLVEVVRTGSLPRAAESPHVTRPAVSMRIEFMEEQYGCPLPDCAGNRMRPTRAGEGVSFPPVDLLVDQIGTGRIRTHRVDRIVRPTASPRTVCPRE
jgi:DNA-binding transcriptional LysR family regulator